MKRLEARSAVLPDYPVLVTVFDVCLRVRMGLNGSMDPLPADQFDNRVRFLRTCLDTWDESQDRFDAAAREMIEATLEMAGKGGRA